MFSGELYLELHRGTLTNQHNIKHNNRKAELALRDLEYLTVSNAVKSGEIASVSPVTSRLPNSDPRRNRANMMNMPP